MLSSRRLATDGSLFDSRFQPASAGQIALEDGEVHVWAVPLTGDPEVLRPLLCPAELQRMERFRVLDHRRRYAISHGALRAILGGYTGESPEELAFQHGPKGKPYLDAAGAGRGEWFFNLSHAGQLALVAVGRRELGIDLEKVRHLESFLEIAKRHFTAAEFEALRAVPQDQRLQCFYRCWTRKEAYIKAVGEGLSMSLDGFDVSLDGEARFLAFREGSGRPGEWSLQDVSPGADYVAALAVHGPGPRLCTFALTLG